MAATNPQSALVPSSEENMLVQSLRQGDPAAQELFYKLYKKMLAAKATYLLGWQDPDIEDVVQESFAAAFQSIASFQGRSRLSTWLTQICVNKAFDRLRRRKRGVLMEQEGLESLLTAQALAASPQAEATLLANERRRLLNEGLAKIGAACAELLRLRYQEGLSFTQIKEALRQPLGTVTARLWRCQEMLTKLVRKV